MLSFFKKKHTGDKEEFSLNQGIFFEDTNQFLEWGRSTEQIAKYLNAKKVYRADRIIYEWGAHKILNGLELDLYSLRWTNDLNDRPDQFGRIEFSAEGQEISKQYFDSILKHIEKQYGEREPEGELPDMSYEWKLGYVKLNLRLFNNKLNFAVSIM